MSEHNFSQLLSKKAYEISYALFRIAAAVKRPSFADHLENKGLSLIEETVAENYSGTRMVSRGIEYLLSFGADVDVVSRANAETIIQELKALDAATAEFEKSAKVPALDFDNVFSKLPVSVKNGTAQDARVMVGVEQEVPAHDYMFIGENQNGSGNGGSNGNHSLVKSAMRQSAILERIRQNGNCRLKEIQDILPETSERTIRYDLQNLLEQGLIERMGSGGPATFYKARG